MEPTDSQATLGTQGGSGVPTPGDAALVEHPRVMPDGGRSTRTTSSELPDYQASNYRDTPNRRFIDEWLAGMYHQYRYEDLVALESSELYAVEHELGHKFDRFRMKFPPGEGLQGEMRAFVLDNANEDREALTPRERERLRLAERDLRKRVKRARGDTGSGNETGSPDIESLLRTLRSALELLKEWLRL